MPSTLALPAELTQKQATACLRQLVQGLTSEPDTAVVVDASALTHFDSAALAVLLACRREALARGKTFTARNLPAKLKDLADLYGIGTLLPAA